MTETQLQNALGALTPANQQIVIAAALVLRTARDAGDTRPAAQIVAHVMARQPSTPAH